ncbi:rifin [Plasmodium falciparum IGH-CR14]|nr:rifin [Plasmodium falciparum IGH-CR14]
MEIVSFGLKYFGVDNLFPDIFKNFVNTKPYNEITTIANSILGKYFTTCTWLKSGATAHPACTKFQLSLRIHLSETDTYGTPAPTAIRQGLEGILENATKTANARAAEVSSETSSKILTKQTDVINTIYMSNQTAIIASIIAILIIVLIMVIIYLILRYRRKKKMKKKLQYIKLLEE